jgi:hypothetical protein
MPSDINFPKDNYTYRVVNAFEHLTVGQELKVLSTNLSTDPRAAGGKGFLQIVCTNCIVNLDRAFDAAVIKILPKHLQEIGPFDHEQGFHEFKEYLQQQHMEAKGDAHILKDLIKEDLLKNLQKERASNPNINSKELFKAMRRQKRQERLDDL